MFELTESHKPGMATAPIGNPMFRSVKRLQLLEARAPEMTVHSAALGCTQLHRVKSTGHTIRLTEAEQFTVLAVQHGRIEIDLETSRIAARSGDTILLPPGERETTVISGGLGAYEARCVLLPADILLDRQSDAGMSWVLYRRACLLAGPDGNLVGGTLNEYLRFLFEQRKQDANHLMRRSAKTAAGNLVVELVREMLAETAVSSAPMHSATEGDLHLVLKTEELMRSRIGDALTVISIATDIGVSPRRLQYAFRSVRGETPKSALNRLRLERAREILTDPDPNLERSVSAVAFACGFSHFGRFAAAYSAQFGETPSKTLRRRVA